MTLWWVVPAALAHGGVSGFDAHGLRLATGNGEPRALVSFARPGDIDGLGWSLGGDVGYPSRIAALEDGGTLDLAAGFAPVSRVRLDLPMPWLLARPVGREGGTALGAGVGIGTKRRSRDADGDGFSKRDDTCPDDAETKNDYRDDDGCPDTVPQLEFVAKRGEADEPGAALTVVRVGDSDAPAVGMGRVVATAMPGTSYTATAKIGACFGGTVEAQIPAEGTLVVPIEITRQDAQITVSVTDAIGRPLEGAEARYLVEDDACAPIDTRVKNGRGIHVVGAGPVTVFLTAPGYGVLQESLTLSPGQMEIVEARLAPTQVALRDGVFDLARPLQFGSGTAILGASSNTLLGQVASLMMSNEGQKFQITAYAPAGADSKRLSQARAATVVRQLVSLGVPAEALVGVGKGALPSRQRAYVTIKVLP